MSSAILREILSPKAAIGDPRRRWPSIYSDLPQDFPFTEPRCRQLLRRRLQNNQIRRGVGEQRYESRVWYAVFSREAQYDYDS